MKRTTAVVIACVRVWTHIYTWRLPPAARDARCDEIESDLWESSHDPQMTQAEILIQIVTRLTLGVADDLAWRLAQVTVDGTATLRTLTAVAVICLLLLVARSPLITDVPRLPDAPLGALQTHSMVPKPPPPPPAPAAPATNAGELVFQYGRTSYSLVAEGPPPVRTKAVQPVYPPVAVAAGLEGDVLVQARITEGGRVTDAEVAPAGILGQSAIDAVQQWEFAAIGNRRRGPALLTVRVSFARSP